MSLNWETFLIAAAGYQPSCRRCNVRGDSPSATWRRHQNMLEKNEWSAELSRAHCDALETRNSTPSSTQVLHAGEMCLAVWRSKRDP